MNTGPRYFAYAIVNDTQSSLYIGDSYASAQSAVSRCLASCEDQTKLHGNVQGDIFLMDHETVTDDTSAERHIIERWTL